jgi:hypothetical protein
MLSDCFGFVVMMVSPSTQRQYKSAVRLIRLGADIDRLERLFVCEFARCAPAGRNLCDVRKEQNLLSLKCGTRLNAQMRAARTAGWLQNETKSAKDQSSSSFRTPFPCCFLHRQPALGTGFETCCVSATLTTIQQLAGICQGK